MSDLTSRRWLASSIWTVAVALVVLLAVDVAGLFPPPASALELSMQARAELAAGRPATAIALCDQAIAVDPDLGQAYLTKSRAFLERPANDARWAAIRVLDDLLSRQGTRLLHGEAHRAKGDAYLELEHWNDALLSYTAAIEIDEHDRRAYLGRREAYSRLFELEEHPMPDWRRRPTH